MNDSHIAPGLKQEQDLLHRYEIARHLMQGLRTQRVVQNDCVLPRWIGQSDCFWYTRTFRQNADREDSIGTEYRLVNAATRSREAAFDHEALARALSAAAGQVAQAFELPISAITMTLSPRCVCFSAFGRRWRFEQESSRCVELDTALAETLGYNELLSPDGRRIAFLRDYNLWVRDVTTGAEQTLTRDGEEFNCYAATASAGGMVNPLINAQWSPDSKRIFTARRDTRSVKTHPLVTHIPADGELRPTVDMVKLAMKGDEELELYRLLSIDVDEGRVIHSQYAPMAVGADDFGFFTSSRRAWWAPDSRRAFFIDYQTGYQSLKVVELDADTGATRVLIEDSGEPYVHLQPEYMDSSLFHYLPGTDELIWWSERSGWGHLYLYDLKTGRLKNVITEGDWRLRNILHVDTERRELVVQTAARTPGRNPYYRDICRAHMDTGELTTLLSTDHEYVVHLNLTQESMLVPGHDGKVEGVAPGANYLVTTRSRADQVPVSLLLDRDGKVVMEVETADISNLPKGWTWPEPVEAKAPDGKTDLYGLLFRPSNFSEDKSYPVINLIVGGAWLAAVPCGSFHNCRGYYDRNYFQGAALAELGFMVVIINSRGTAHRDKAFQNFSYGWLPAGANTQDHREFIEQLGQRYPQMNLKRVGVYGPTGYHGALSNLFEAPDFYSVGVINSPMDARLASRTSEHVDKYQGVDGPPPGKHYPEELAENWNGKLLLIQRMDGALARCYPPAGGFRVLDAMRRADKDVDLLAIFEGEGALMSGHETRRAWDYLVRHLHDTEPPTGFKLGDFFD